MRTINIADITLKKLSEDRAISLLFREKSAIANCADTLGVNSIELPAIKNLREDTIIYRGDNASSFLERIVSDISVDTEKNKV